MVAAIVSFRACVGIAISASITGDTPASIRTGTASMSVAVVVVGASVRGTIRSSPTGRTLALIRTHATTMPVAVIDVKAVNTKTSIALVALTTDACVVGDVTTSMSVAPILVLAIRLGAKLTAPTGTTRTRTTNARTVISAVYTVACRTIFSIAVSAGPSGIAYTRQTPGTIAVCTSVPTTVVHRRIKWVIPEFAVIPVIVWIAPA